MMNDRHEPRQAHLRASTSEPHATADKPRYGGQAHLDPVGLCRRCAHAQIVTSSRGSQFYLCRLSYTDPEFPRYPRLPVVECRGYTPTGGGGLGG